MPTAIPKIRKLVRTLPSNPLTDSLLTPTPHQRKLRVPKHITAAITYQVIHGNVPELLKKDGDPYEFYGHPTTWNGEI